MLRHRSARARVQLEHERQSNRDAALAFTTQRYTAFSLYIYIYTRPLAGFPPPVHTHDEAAAVFPGDDHGATLRQRRFEVPALPLLTRTAQTKQSQPEEPLTTRSLRTATAGTLAFPAASLFSFSTFREKQERRAASLLQTVSECAHSEIDSFSSADSRGAGAAAVVASGGGGLRIYRPACPRE